ncbi:FtsX-like permease family protein [Bariatricus massiliensis]|uniref:FtsX-like permease family protein n=1 Tax=Bariatricus massiliensis TaxID=1745713 RepID=A0ABS8DFE1_9FIRM|nr:FtsX-like permease family protein [Bariatricus massiliensis]MCB7304013.1 FtsX-like permease family protein [Bariatricus massiliensis]MCB7374556.1 FtsX-like permease family protein [Bariatricus massiliensis]MCB7387123.1 FtsX-like permease family protein [Bariatricus massiliensis]MCB7411285.1 FtsX-like permease family protein [Bariatricus massiliensis]MCQ5252769.1 FtsX-like permease family protein [Bariatricus massiliensis]
MENRILFRAGIRRHKGSLIGIAVLLFLVSLSLSTVLTVSLGGGSYIRQEMQRAGFGSLTAWVSGVPDMELLTDSIKAQEGIEGLQVQNLLFSDYEAKGVESDSEGQLILWSGGDKTYRFFRNDLSGYSEAPKEIAHGTVYVSPSMISIMNLQIGDSITFPIARGGQNVSLTVAGYYEDPFMGSSMIGMKGFLICEADYTAILQDIAETGMDSLARNGAMLHIFTEAGSNASIADISQLLNENTTISQYTEFIHSADAIEGFMGILQNAFCGLLAAFALILLAAAMVVLGHSISGVMEQDYKNLGILKTIGLTGGGLVRVQLAQYLAAMLVGILPGILAAYPAAKAAGRMTLTTTGVLLPADLPVLPCMAAFTAILLLLMGFTVLKLRKISSVTPMKAIRGETTEIRWKPGKSFQMKIEGLPFRLAVRQLLSGKKRYVSACLIAVLLVFFASLAGRMNTWLGPEGKGMMDAFNPADLDIGVQAMGELEPEEMENMVRSYTDITDSYLLAMPSVSVNGTNYTANVITEPERFHISQGDTSRSPDEVVLTETAASDQGVGIGDKVTVRGDTGSGEFTVSGIYHCANDMGANIGMNREGYLTIGQDAPQLWCHHYFLADPSKRTAVTEALTEAYGGDVHVHENSWPGLFGIIAAMHGLLVFMYGMIALFVLIVVLMAGGRILAAEQKDLGIYKSMGCSVKMLRVTFSLRFGIVASIGAAGGTVLAAILTDSFVSAVMRLAGISNFASRPDLSNIVLPGLIVVLLFLGCSYLAAGRIKKADMAVLTAD